MSVEGSTKTGAAGRVISMPRRAGAPDHLAGPGRAAAPGHGSRSPHGPIGLDWQHLPAVSRRTTRGVPRYTDATRPGVGRPDVFVLLGAEDLFPTGGSYPGRVRYRSRSDGLFAEVEHVRDSSGDCWEVRGRDGLLTRYGTPRPVGTPADWQDPAVISDPDDRRRVFEWRITRIQDPLGNVVRYEYLRDRGAATVDVCAEPMIARISHADYGDRANPAAVVTMEFDYELRPDPLSDDRAGFEVRTSLRCRTIRVVTQAADGVPREANAYRLHYGDASVLNRMEVDGVDELADHRTA
jgi:hypothetical protein